MVLFRTLPDDYTLRYWNQVPILGCVSCKQSMPRRPYPSVRRPSPRGDSRQVLPITQGPIGHPCATVFSERPLKDSSPCYTLAQLYDAVETE